MTRNILPAMVVSGIAAIAQLLFTGLTWPIPSEKASFFHEIRTKKIKSDAAVVWKNFGPGMSGYCEGFWCHPTDADVMFMGPDMHVSYGTWDGGKSWQTLKDCDGPGQEMKRVLDIEFSHQQPDFGMALNTTELFMNPGIYLSEDDGSSWRKINRGLGQPDKIVDVKPDPYNENVLWCASWGCGWFVAYLHGSKEGWLKE